MLSQPLRLPFPSNSPHEMVSADFNLDGQPDIAQAVNQQVAIYLQKTGTWPVASRPSLGTANVGRILTADFNGDKRPDLMAYKGDAWRVLLGDGTGGFEVYPQSGAGENVITGDFNGDGKPDLVAASRNAGALLVTVALGDGTGNFTRSTFTGPDSGDYPVPVAGDLNKDGRTDLVVCSSGSTNTLRYLGNGDGTFGAPASFTRWDPVRGAVIADLNGDGNPDLATQDDNFLSILLGDGAGGFAPLQVINGPNTSSSGLPGTTLTCGDFNGDGLLDLASTDGDTNSFRWFAGRSGDIPALPQVYTNPSGGAYFEISAADLNRDGVTDVMFNAFSGYLYYGKSSGPLPLASTSVPTGASALAVADCNGDGKGDAVVGHSTGVVTRLLGNGTFGTGTQVASLGSAVQTVVAGDLNADNLTDLTVVLTNKQIWTLRGRGDGTFAAAQQVAATTGTPVRAVVRDFTGDGRPDLAVCCDQTLEILPGNGNGSFSSSFGSYATLLSGYGVVSADFNGDGSPDLAALDLANQKVLGLLGTAFASVLETAVGACIDLDTGDLNGDGQPDLALLSTNGVPVLPLLGAGDGRFTVGTAFGSGGGNNLVVGRFTADALGDPVVTSSNTFQLHINQVEARYNGWTGTLSKAATGDVNGDGKLDLVMLIDNAVQAAVGI